MHAQPLHASAFAYQGVGCLLLGVSGSGKSRLLAEALVLGAQLIADDQVQVTNEQGQLMASAPHALAGVVELRGVGLVQLADRLQVHPIHLVVSLGAVESPRLPEPQSWEYAGERLPHLQLSATPLPHVASLLLYLKAMQAGRILPTDWRPEA